jgi:H+-translocating NAD(P) transhydrogenase subunit alpha
MSCRVGVPKEVAPGERRVALVPSIIEKYLKLGVDLIVQRGAGAGAFRADVDYEAKGALLVDAPERVYRECDVVLKVRPPDLDEIPLMRPKTVVLGYMNPHRHPEWALAMRDRGLTSFAMELLPRITRAQSMDALTSQAAVSGYKAVLIAANLLGGFFPMLTTPAGTIRPAKVLVLGAGVAGLQAIATAKRLGAVVEAYDVRRATAEQVQSLGAKFVSCGVVDAEASGGYARPLTEEEKCRERDMLADHVAAADVVITTAAIPGRDAPKLVFKDMVDRMKEGSVLLDLSASTGGNCELTRPGEDYVTDNLVTIAGPLNVPAMLPSDASELYARNLLNFLAPQVKAGELVLDWNDQVIKESCLTHDGGLCYELAIPATMDAQLKRTLERGAVS